MTGSKKTIGILGGMGPYATLDFMRLLLDLTPAESERDHIRVLVDSNPSMPSRTRAYLYNEADPSPMMLNGIQALMAAGADFIVVPCNSAHYFLPGIRQQFTFPGVDMIEATARVVARLSYRTVGLLAGEVTVGAGLYEAACGDQTTILQVSDDEQSVVRSIIEDVKMNQVSDQTRASYRALISGLKTRGAEVVILGCTELQAVSDGTEDLPTLDSLKVLAEQAIARALND